MFLSFWRPILRLRNPIRQTVNESAALGLVGPDHFDGIGIAADLGHLAGKVKVRFDDDNPIERQQTDAHFRMI
ncbi:hypothetical protein KFU94_69490 [Chloroflexi bacterium TSY]|nr:hypothetical protein [Chloroflexi bacterium TSY]